MTTPLTPIKIVTSFATLMRLAGELKQAKKSGDAKRITEAQKAHDAYADLCRHANKMMLHKRMGDL